MNPSNRTIGKRGGLETGDPASEPPPLAKAAVVYAGLLLLAAALSWPATSELFDTANRPPSALPALRAAADPVASPPVVVPQSAVLLLVDGMRVDEADRLPALLALRARSAWTVARVPIPTLSRPFYHTLLTGVPQNGSGVRTNRFAGPARFDSLADRLRAAGGRFAVVADRLNWVFLMHGHRGDFRHVGRRGFARAIEAGIGYVAARPPSLLFVHFTDVDASAHHDGVESPAHQRALRTADVWIAHLARETARRRMPFIVLSDHGHIDPGGHGGDEPVVHTIPFVVRAPTLAPGRRPPLRARELAPIVARVIGVAPPRSAVATVPPAWGDGSAPGLRRDAAIRASLMRAGERRDEARLSLRRLWSAPFVLLMFLAGLGATKRSFAGLDAGSFLAPAAWLVSVPAVHVLVFARPLSLSAIDELNRQGARLVLTGALCAVVAIELGTFVPWLASSRRARRTPSAATRLRRSAAATGLVAVTTAVGAFAWVGWALGPWPLPAIGYYLPVLTAGAGAGACIAAAITLLASLLVPVLYERFKPPGPS